MKLSQITSVDTTSSILFLGSGFSLDARNQQGNSPPNGAQLKTWIEEELKLASPTQYDLRILSDELIDRDAATFARTLRDKFRITASSDVQNKIVSENWRRIYTTNYDDLVEKIYSDLNRPIPSFDISDRYPNKLENGAIIHLHGSIRMIHEDNLRTSIVLGERSYVDQMLHESRWYDQFLRDVAFADRIFFVGYSLTDYLISSLLNQHATIADKTVFILRGPTDQIEINRISPYGTIEEVGASGFADWLAKTPRIPPAADINALKAFRPLSPHRDKKAGQEATAPEVHDMLVYGNFDPGRLASSLPGESYVTRRQKELDQAILELTHARTLLVDSRIGNGKTVFLHLLAAALTERRYKPFLFRPGHPALNQEVAALEKIENIVIFFERYGDAEDSLPDLLTSLPNAKFVAEIRTALFEVRFHDLKRVTNGKYKRVTVNPLVEHDEASILALARRAGIPVGMDRTTSYGELRYILLDVFKNPKIQERIRSQLQPLFKNPNLRKILACSALLGRNHTKFGLDLLRAIYKFDPFVELRDTDGLSAEIFEFDTDGFRLRSALLSDFLLQEYVDPDEIADAAGRLVKYSAERRDIRAYRVLMGELMAFGSLFSAFGADDHATKRIIGLYEDWRHDERINNEPLFWLQFAIASVEDRRIDLGINYIETAYDRAEQLEGFQSYQIDTQAFRIFLLNEIQHTGGLVREFDRIMELFESVERMLKEDSHRFHAVKVLENVEPFLEVRKCDFTEGEKVALVFRLNSASRTLKELPVDFRVRAGADLTSQLLSDLATDLVT